MRRCHIGRASRRFVEMTRDSCTAFGRAYNRGAESSGSQMVDEPLDPKQEGPGLGGDDADAGRGALAGWRVARRPASLAGRGGREHAGIFGL